jgi:hypothetical protein
MSLKSSNQRGSLMRMGNCVTQNVWLHLDLVIFAYYLWNLYPWDDYIIAELLNVGKRFCLGETQATPALFLYFTTLLKHFEFSTMPNECPTTEPLPGFTLSPQPFNMKIKERN